MRLIEACSYPLYGGKALRRQRPAAAQIFASLVFDLSHFYATVADFRTRVQYLFSKPRYSVLMSLHLGRSRAVRGIRQRIKRHAKQAIGKRASERVKQPICQNEIRPSRQVIEKFGAGEGNRTLVFSLEVSKYCSVFSDRSDIFQVFDPL